jgi:NCS2 family nucleobase:cation symporter-2
MLSFLFLIMAFFPKIVGLFLLIPLPIAGVALLVNCSFMMLAGIQIITIRPIDIRTIYTVGIAILTGISRIMLPEYYDKLPDGWKIVTTSALTITTISALLMTLLFRIGIKKNLVLDKDAPLGKPQEFNHYLKTQFNRWAVPEVIMEKASTCGEQILNSLIQTGLNPDAIKVNTSFDKINLKLEYEYEGEFPSLNLNEGMSKKYYVEEQAFYLGLSRLLSGVFPDDHHFVMKGKQCSLTFWFYC